MKKLLRRILKGTSQEQDKEILLKEALQIIQTSEVTSYEDLFYATKLLKGMSKSKTVNIVVNDESGAFTMREESFKEMDFMSIRCACVEFDDESRAPLPLFLEEYRVCDESSIQFKIVSLMLEKWKPLKTLISTVNYLYQFKRNLLFIRMKNQGLKKAYLLGHDFPEEFQRLDIIFKCEIINNDLKISRAPSRCRELIIDNYQDKTWEELLEDWNLYMQELNDDNFIECNSVDINRSTIYDINHNLFENVNDIQPSDIVYVDLSSRDILIG